MSEYIHPVEAMAWIAWRTRKACDYFSADGVEAGIKAWDRALNGDWPKRLGKPKITPRAAQEEFVAALRSGAVRGYILGE